MTPDKKLIKEWGTEEQYFKELERWHKEHSSADAIEVNTILGCPTKAIYYFRPYTVHVDRDNLRTLLAQECTSEPEASGDE